VYESASPEGANSLLPVMCTLPPNVKTGNQAGGLSSAICERKEGDDCGSQPASAAMRKEEEAVEFSRDSQAGGSMASRMQLQPSRTKGMGSCRAHGRIAY
jgi:hypothetical protein